MNAFQIFSETKKIIRGPLNVKPDAKVQPPFHALELIVNILYCGLNIKKMLY